MAGQHRDPLRGRDSLLWQLVGGGVAQQQRGDGWARLCPRLRHLSQKRHTHKGGAAASSSQL